jgi:hypothetical protein
MENLEPNLLLRYWQHKGRPGTLLLKRFGMNLIVFETFAGEIYIYDPKRDVTGIL